MKLWLIQLSNPFFFTSTPVLSSGNSPQEEEGRSQNCDSWWQKTPGLIEEIGSEQHCRDRRGELSKKTDVIVVLYLQLFWLFCCCLAWCKKIILSHPLMLWFNVSFVFYSELLKLLRYPVQIRLIWFDFLAIKGLVWGDFLSQPRV